MAPPRWIAASDFRAFLTELANATTVTEINVAALAALDHLEPEPVTLAAV